MGTCVVAASLTFSGGCRTEGCSGGLETGGEEEMERGGGLSGLTVAVKGWVLGFEAAVEE